MPNIIINIRISYGCPLRKLNCIKLRPSKDIVGSLWACILGGLHENFMGGFKVRQTSRATK